MVKSAAANSNGQRDDDPIFSYLNKIEDFIL